MNSANRIARRYYRSAKITEWLEWLDQAQSGGYAEVNRNDYFYLLNRFEKALRVLQEETAE